MTGPITVTIAQYANAIQVSRQLLDGRADFMSVLWEHWRISEAQGRFCLAVTRDGHRCKRVWKHVRRAHGYCWQHRP